MSYDQPSPADIHFTRKLASITSIEELSAFNTELLNHRQPSEDEIRQIQNKQAQLLEALK